MNNWKKYIDELYEKYQLDKNKTAIKYKNYIKDYYLFTHEDFNALYETVNEYMLKDGKLTDQIKNMNSVMRSESKNSMRQSYYIVKNNFDSVINYDQDYSILKHYDEVSKEPYFRWINYYMGNGALGASINKKIRDALILSGNFIDIIDNCDLLPIQLIIDGPPGTGKSYEVKKRYTHNTTKHERVTFYADYEYHNFVGSVLPVLNNGNISYEFIPGPFTKILSDALSNPLEPYYLIIEELTRGNASGIFGDVFQLLDRENDGWSEYPVTNLSIFNSLTDKNKNRLISKFDKEVIALPPNLNIICTINSSDQNVYPLDTAFKRRFIYEMMSTQVTDTNQIEELKYLIQIGKGDYMWYDVYTTLNKFILKEMCLKEDKQIGPYFIKKDENSVMISKLALYLWNDIHKVHTTTSVKLFADEILTLSEVNKLMNDDSLDVKAIFSKQFLKFWDENSVQD